MIFTYSLLKASDKKKRDRLSEKGTKFSHYVMSLTVIVTVRHWFCLLNWARVSSGMTSNGKYLMWRWYKSDRVVSSRVSSFTSNRRLLAEMIPGSWISTTRNLAFPSGGSLKMTNFGSEEVDFFSSVVEGEGGKMKEYQGKMKEYQVVLNHRWVVVSAWNSGGVCGEYRQTCRQTGSWKVILETDGV